MKAYDFCSDWQVRRLGERECRKVTLPHDGMIGEARSSDSASGEHGGWFEGHDYEYEKEFFLPQEGEGKTYIFEFEGVYHNAEVYVNGAPVCARPYGYTNFYVTATHFLHFGQVNRIRVIARNADQPNCRWYSGAGIYRPVKLWVSEEERILLNGIKIRTLSLSPAKIEVRVKTSGQGTLSLDILYGKERVTSAQITCSAQGEGQAVLTVKDAKLWSAETPNLYLLRAKFFHDTCEETFGIRTLTCNAEKGFCVNGARVILRGACIHHDNGILGARCYEEAERRKVRLLRVAGYNAVRSAHNPCSKALLRACDEEGMYLIDEYVDTWYIHKTKYDYATSVEKWYSRDIADMIEKDYNHPCVVMYSLGNEVAETSQPRGVKLYQKMQSFCHLRDSTRPVTVGVNIFFNLLYSLGFGVYSDKKAEKSPKKKVGSEFFNHLAGKLGGKFMKRMATLSACDKQTRDIFAVADVAGYNYGILRYEKDVKRYPNRVILGSETFCADAYEFYELAQKYPAIIGDFVWAGMDYLGEVGVGSWEYRDYAPDFSHGVGWISAGSGRINLVGTTSGETLYTRVAFGLEKRPRIAVRPVNHTGERHSPSAWKFTNAIPSWSWAGCEGKKAVVEVYTRADFVALFLNGKKLKKKRRKKGCRLIFKTRYRAGELKAVAYGKGKGELASSSLVTAGEKTVLSVLPETTCARAGEVCFVRLRYTDVAGEVKPLMRGKISVRVSGGKLLALGSACPFQSQSYLRAETDTYYGEALAVVQTGSGWRTVIECVGAGLFGQGEILAEEGLYE